MFKLQLGEYTRYPPYLSVFTKFRKSPSIFGQYCMEWLVFTLDTPFLFGYSVEKQI